jgi:hypothetical protein
MCVVPTTKITLHMKSKPPKFINKFSKPRKHCKTTKSNKNYINKIKKTKKSTPQHTKLSPKKTFNKTEQKITNQTNQRG